MEKLELKMKELEASMRPSANFQSEHSKADLRQRMADLVCEVKLLQRAAGMPPDVSESFEISPQK
jgi:hypothetical protein